MSRLLHHDLFDYTSGRWPLLESILPHVLLAGVPERLQNYGDSVSQSTTPPLLPANFDELAETERTDAEGVYRRSAFEVWQNVFGLGLDGWVPAQEAVALCTQAKEKALAEATSEEERAEIMAHWPWDDMGEGKSYIRDIGYKYNVPFTQSLV
ncbi:hypothetical protein IEO21_09973 [Rhodonia placenta]|uniref:Uncharacterized protein n=1 Tax=Rhodonia placenta TaxID=104341 RepID=A0A8H7NTP8_9APHY|nr:hypothetical protein IEO21_09973 [Postia placenta]